MQRAQKISDFKSQMEKASLAPTPCSLRSESCDVEIAYKWWVSAYRISADVVFNCSFDSSRMR
jgi:hypothetical protein